MLCSAPLFSQVIQTNDRIKGKFRKWYPVFIKFKGPTTSETALPNPFTDYRLDVTFTSPSGKKFTVPGFYAADGKAAKTSATKGNIWKTIFTPNEVGDWTYKAKFFKGAMIAAHLTGGTPAGYFHGNNGSFTINPTDVGPYNKNLRGKGKLEYVGGHHLVYQGTGKPFMKAGANSPEVFLEYKDFDNTPSNRSYSAHISQWQQGNPTWKNGKGKGIIGMVNNLSNKGINAIYFLTQNHEGDGKKAWPWISTSKMYRYDCSKLDQWDKVFRHMDRSGMMIHFVTTETENEALFETVEFGNPGGFSYLRKIYYRELVARFGYHLAITWNVGEENGWNDRVGNFWHGNSTAQRKDFAKRIRQLTYYKDHIVVHNGPSSDDGIFYSLLGNPNYTGPSLQWDYRNNIHGKVKEWRNRSSQNGRKWVVSIDEAYTSSETYSLDHWRKEIVWGSIMAGGAGAELYIGAGKDVQIDNMHPYSAYHIAAGKAAYFMQTHVPFHQMAPVTNFIPNGWTLKNKNNCLLYLKNGGSASILLPQGKYDIRWFDPRNGGGLKKGSKAKMQGGAKRSIGTAPNNTSKDWVVLIKKVTTTPNSFAPPPEAPFEESAMVEENLYDVEDAEENYSEEEQVSALHLTRPSLSQSFTIDGPSTLEVWNVQGTLVHSVSVNGGNTAETMNSLGLAPGNYLITLKKYELSKLQNISHHLYKSIAQ